MAARPESAQARTEARACVGGSGDAAIAACRRALDLGMKPARAAVVNGVLASRLADEGDWEGAAAPLREWCRLAPADPEPRRRLADVLLYGLGRTDDAERVLREAAVLAPLDAALQGALGGALAAAGRYQEATVAFGAAQSLDPTFFESRPASRGVADAAREGRPWP